MLEKLIFITSSLHRLTIKFEPSIALLLKVVVGRGLRRVEKIAENSKQAFSLMFCGSASGVYLPPMAVYKAENLYEGWIQGGPKGKTFC